MRKERSTGARLPGRCISSGALSTRQPMRDASMAPPPRPFVYAQFHCYLDGIATGSVAARPATAPPTSGFLSRRSPTADHRQPLAQIQLAHPGDVAKLAVSVRVPNARFLLA